MTLYTIMNFKIRFAIEFFNSDKLYYIMLTIRVTSAELKQICTIFSLKLYAQPTSKHNLVFIINQSKISSLSAHKCLISCPVEHPFMENRTSLTVVLFQEANSYYHQFKTLRTTGEQTWSCTYDKSTNQLKTSSLLANQHLIACPAEHPLIASSSFLTEVLFLCLLYTTE